LHDDLRLKNNCPHCYHYTTEASG